MHCRLARAACFEARHVSTLVQITSRVCLSKRDRNGLLFCIICIHTCEGEDFVNNRGTRREEEHMFSSSMVYSNRQSYVWFVQSAAEGNG
jgi:hypothetical protein